MENEVKRTTEEIKQDVVRTILGEGVDFTITVAKPNILHKLRLVPIERKFIIYPIKMGTLLQMTKVLITLDSSQLNMLKDKEDTEEIGSFLTSAIGMIHADGDKLVKIVAYALKGNKKEPSKRFLRYLEDNLNAQELLKILILVIRQMDVTDFLACMVSATGINLVETKKRKSISGKSSEE